MIQDFTCAKRKSVVGRSRRCCRACLVSSDNKMFSVREREGVGRAQASGITSLLVHGSPPPNAVVEGDARAFVERITFNRVPRARARENRRSE